MKAELVDDILNLIGVLILCAIALLTGCASSPDPVGPEIYHKQYQSQDIYYRVNGCAGCMAGEAHTHDPSMYGGTLCGPEIEVKP